MVSMYLITVIEPTLCELPPFCLQAITALSSSVVLWEE